MMWAAMSSNSFAVVKFATAKLKMKTLPAGSPWHSVVPPSSSFSDRHSNRSVLLLRIADFVVDAVDVLDVSVTEIVVFPPSKHCILRHCFNAWRPSAFKRRIQCSAF